MAQKQAARVGWIGGALIAMVVSAYIWLVLQPSDLITQLWLAIPVAALWLGARFVREITYGIIRYRNEPAAIDLD